MDKLNFQKKILFYLLRRIWLALIPHSHFPHIPPRGGQEFRMSFLDLRDFFGKEDFRGNFRVERF